MVIAFLEFLPSLLNEQLEQFLASVSDFDHCLLHGRIAQLLSFAYSKEHCEMKFNGWANFVGFQGQVLLQISLGPDLMMVAEYLIHFKLFLDCQYFFISCLAMTELTLIFYI